MTTTLIDQAIDAFVAALAPTPGVTGVYEARPSAFMPTDAPAIDVTLQDAECRPLGDNNPARSVLHVVVQLELAIYTRSAFDAAGKEVSARRLAAPVWASAHALLMADPSLGGLAVRVRWRRSTWRKEAADGSAGWASHSYELTLAMREQDLLSPK